MVLGGVEVRNALQICNVLSGFPSRRITAEHCKFVIDFTLFENSIFSIFAPPLKNYVWTYLA